MRQIILDRNLKEINLFSDLTAGELEIITQVGGLKNYAKGEIIFHSGKKGEECFFILEGRLKLCQTLEDGREVSFEIIEPGDMFGEGTLLENPRYSCNAEILEDTRVLILPRQQIFDFIEQNGRFGLKLVRYMTRRLVEFRQRQEMLLYSVNIRLARLLLGLAKKYGVTTPQGVKINLKLTHQELANLIGTARETLTLTIGKFRREGLLTKTSGSILIRSIAELEIRANLNTPAPEVVEKDFTLEMPVN